MSATKVSPLLRLEDDWYYGKHSELPDEIAICGEAFQEAVLPSWTGTLPQAIRLHITPNPKGALAFVPSVGEVRVGGGSEHLMVIASIWLRTALGVHRSSTTPISFDAVMEVVRL